MSSALNDASPTAPIYTKVPHGTNSNLWMITCDEGWRQSIVCEGVYDWAADWLLKVLERRPYPHPTQDGA